MGMMHAPTAWRGRSTSEQGAAALHPASPCLSASTMSYDPHVRQEGSLSSVEAPDAAYPGVARLCYQEIKPRPGNQSTIVRASFPKPSDGGGEVVAAALLEPGEVKQKSLRAPSGMEVRKLTKDLLAAAADGDAVAVKTCLRDLQLYFKIDAHDDKLRGHANNSAMHLAVE